MAPDPAANVGVRRVHDAPHPDDGHRVLVDRLWPRGLSREDVHLDAWARELAPSSALRTWFGHDPARFEAFRRRYRAELAEHAERLDELRSIARTRGITLLHAARDRENNNAVVLAELLRDG